MKQLLFLLLIISAVASCKKEGAPAVKEKLLSRIYQDDVLQYEFEYSSDQRLKKLMKFTGGSLTLFQVYLYEYDGKGQLKQKITTDGSGKPSSKLLYTWTDQGQMVKYTATFLSGTDSGEVYHWVSFAYNERKKLIKITHFQDDDNPSSSQVLDYDDNGALLEMRSYSEKPEGSSLIYRYEYTGANFRIHPAFWKAWIEPGDLNLSYYHATSIKITQYDDGVVKTINTYAMSDRKTDDPSTGWKEQTITYQRTFPAGFNPDIRKMRYEYIEL